MDLSSKGGGWFPLGFRGGGRIGCYGGGNEDEKGGGKSGIPTPDYFSSLSSVMMNCSVSVGVAQHTEGGEEREKAEHLALRTRCVEIWRERP